MSARALSSDVTLCMAKVELEPISDADMYLFFENSMKGEVSYISKRYSKANNKYLKSYDPDLTIYLDAKNLYGYNMSKFHAASEFKWTDPKEFE